MKKVGLLPTLDCEAGYGTEEIDNPKQIIESLRFTRCTPQVAKENNTASLLD